MLSYIFITVVVQDLNDVALETVNHWHGQHGDQVLCVYLQGFAETRRLGASGDAPQCSYTSGPVSHI